MTKDAENYQQIVFRLPCELADRIDEAARREGRTRSAWIRRWLRISLGESVPSRPEADVAEAQR